MALSGPVLVIGEDTVQVREALVRGGNLPMREARRADAPAAIASAGPSAIVLIDPTPDDEAAVASCRDSAEPIVPVIAVTAEPDSASQDALPLHAPSVATRLVPRLRAALRVRALHAAVLRRAAAMAEQGLTAEFPDHDPIEDATVLCAGRGRFYPALTVAIGERMGLIGALSLDTARTYLNARDIDGVVIGDGFNRSMVEDFIAELAGDPRWRDLPVIVPRDLARDLDPERMPNVDQLSGDPEAIARHILPFARLHAFASRVKRMSAALDQKGLLAPDTGLMTCGAFMDELERAAAAASRGAGLSLARLSFGRLVGRRASLDAARITGRLLRASDIACRNDDGSILIAFTETDLVTAHVVARRIASVLKHTTLTVGGERSRLGPTISLAAFRGHDTVESLVARTIDHRMVAAE